MLGAVIVTTVAVVVMSVMVAMSVGIVFKRSLRESLSGCVSRTLHTCVEFDSGSRESILCAHTDTATNQCINLCRLQESRKSAMTATVCIDDLLVYDLSVLDIIEFESLRMSEMLEDFSAVISNCDFHRARAC